MMRSIRTGAVLAAALLASGISVFGQDPPAPKPDEPPPFSSAIALPVDPDLRRKLTAVDEYVRDRAWPEAIALLQSMLDGDEDLFAPIAEETKGGPKWTWLSVRTELNRRIAALPEQGFAFYELTHGPRARSHLDKARTQNDLHLLARVAQCYLHTEAGGEALNLLATYYLDRGLNLLAAGCYERLLQRREAERLPPVVLFRAALAFDRAAHTTRRDEAWKLLRSRAPDGLTFGERKYGLAELEGQFGKKRSAPIGAHGFGDWPMFGGSAARCAGGPQTEVSGDVRWTQSTIGDDTAHVWLQSALQQQEGRAVPALPGGFPIAVDGLILARTSAGIRATDAQSGTVRWESPCDFSLDCAARDAQQLVHVGPWVASYLSNHPHVLFDNTLLGSLSSDGKRVYAVDDLPVPPHPRNFGIFVGNAGQGVDLSLAPELTEAVYSSRLRGIDLASGKLAWELGGRTGKEADPDRPLTTPGRYFLGSPLPHGDGLFVLAEENQELCVLCLRPATGEIAWRQRVAIPRRNLLVDAVRRLNAAHLACAEGILICPTQAGAIVAVDLHARSLRWAYAYREEAPVEPLDWSFRARWRFRAPVTFSLLQPNFKASAPLIVGDKVIFTAADSYAVECLSLRDGTSLWRAERNTTDLYMAGVFGDKILMVGTSTCRALRLSDGAEVWTRPTGLPSGHGAAGPGVYYLPLKAPSDGKGPAIWTMDVQTGAILDQVSMEGEEAPGNLVLTRGTVVSQSATALSALEQRKPK